MAQDAGRALSRGENEALAHAGMKKASTQLKWLLTGNGAPLIEYVKGDIYRLLKDPEGGTKNPYPGCPPGQNPLWTKKHAGKKLSTLVFLVRSVREGAKLTNRMVAVVLNKPQIRRLFGIEDCCYISESAISKAQVKLRKELGRSFRIVEPSVHYRDQHCWKLDQPARYRTGLSMDKTPEGKMITKVIEEIFEKLAIAGILLRDLAA
jgi:hypothetical protein